MPRPTQTSSNRFYVGSAVSTVAVFVADDPHAGTVVSTATAIVTDPSGVQHPVSGVPRPDGSWLFSWPPLTEEGEWSIRVLGEELGAVDVNRITVVPSS